MTGISSPHRPSGEFRRRSGEFARQDSEAPGAGERASSLGDGPLKSPERAFGGRRKSGPYTRIKTPVWSQDLTDVSRFDLRATRDLSSRRLVREWARGVMRTLLLLAGDSLMCVLAFEATIGALGLSRGTAWYVVPRLIVFAIFGQAAAGTYNAGRSHGEYSRVLLGATAASGARLLLETLYDVSGFTLRGHLMLAAFLCLALCSWRFLVARFTRVLYANGIGQKRTLIVGDRDRTFEVLERFRSADEPRVRHMGHIAPGAQDPTSLGSIDDLARLIEQLDISYVLVAGILPKEDFERVVHTCFMHGAAVSVVPGTLTSLPCRVTSREVLGWPLLELQAPRAHMLQVAVKRTMDLLLSSVLVVLLSPVFAIVALAVRLESKGTIFFRQSRPGLGGKQFLMLKFRTMRPDAERLLEANPALLKKFLENDCKLPANEDPRISRVGALLRRTSLDELPQLLNVLRGDMSLIGPRPVVGPELDSYGEWASTVLGVRPGMTGYWQVAGRSAIVFPERAHLDVFYVTRWSLALDLKILLLTIPAVLRRSGAH